MFASCVFYLLFAILSLGSAADSPEPVTCQQCNSSFSCVNTCAFKKNEGSCFIAVEENTLGGKNETFFSKGCSVLPVTSLFFTITLGKGRFLRSNTTFCSEDNCNSDVSIATNFTLNGRECPSCFNSTDNSCTVETVPCTGNETFCTSAYGLVQKEDPKEVSLFVAQGCATESVKNARPPLNIYLLKETYTVYKINTYKAPALSRPTTAAPTTSPNGTPALKSISFVLLLAGLSSMLLVKMVS